MALASLWQHTTPLLFPFLFNRLLPPSFSSSSPPDIFALSLGDVVRRRSDAFDPWTPTSDLRAASQNLPSSSFIFATATPIYQSSLFLIVPGSL